MSNSTDVFESGITSLSPEILLKIFLHLDSHQTVILRSVCKEFLEIIDNNKSLWRVLEWTQQEEESSTPALEMFDEKSGRTLKEVSIFQTQGEPDDRFIEVLDRSKNSLTDLSFKIGFLTTGFRLKMMELASNCHHLESLGLWCSQQDLLSLLPRTHLTRSSRQPYLGTGRSRNLQVLWCFNLMQEWEGKLDVTSLVSFADPFYYGSLQLRSFISKFSTTLIHLAVDLKSDATLSCPSLRILESHFSPGFPSWLDAPKLQIVIARDIDPSFLRQLPISVEELWLFTWYTYLTAERQLDFLSSVCPRLKIVKLEKEIFDEDFDTRSFLESLRAREEKVGKGVEFEGIKMVSLEELIVPTELFASSQLDELREFVGEVIDIEDYPDFIELEH